MSASEIETALKRPKMGIYRVLAHVEENPFRKAARDQLQRRATHQKIVLKM